MLYVIAMHLRFPRIEALKAILTPREIKEWWYVIMNWNRMQQGDKGAFIAFTQRRDGMTPEQLLARYIAEGGDGT